LLTNTLKALSYSCRSICDIVIGISLPLHINIFREIGVFTLVITILLIFIVSYGVSHFSMKRLNGLIKSEIEAFILLT
jgi:hypothetical protein